MICAVNVSLEEKINAIRTRTADQKMARDGVPVSIGGTVFEVQPMPRGRAREFRRAQLQALITMNATVDAGRQEGTIVAATLDVEELDHDTQAKLLALAIPDLTEREGWEAWLDQEATSEEIGDALELATEFADPNRRGAQPTTTAASA